MRPRGRTPNIFLRAEAFSDGYWVLVVEGVVVVVDRRNPIAFMKRWKADTGALVTTAEPFVFTTRTDEVAGVDADDFVALIGVAPVELVVAAVVFVLIAELVFLNARTA